jgi:type IV secretion system protein VirB10
MAFFDRFKPKKPGAERVEPAEDEGLPPDTLAAAASNAKSSKGTDNGTKTNDENEGLPSVNRHKSGNKLITNLGMAAIALIGLAAIMMVNATPGDKAKKKLPEQIANTMPPLQMPAPPAPEPITLAKPIVGAPVAPLSGSGQVIGLQSGASMPVEKGLTAQVNKGPDGKPIVDWWDRKMLGPAVLATNGQQQGKNNLYGGNNAAEAGGDPAADHSKRYLVPASQPTGGAAVAPTAFAGGQTELGRSLVPTVTVSVSADVLADRNFLITKGTSLDCALETALDSSLPGITTCRMTRDVYSDNGAVLLMERGTQLVGEYQGGMKNGQSRLFVLWSRAKTPKGVVVTLNSPGTDALGRSGLEGWVDTHFMERFGAAILMSFIKDTVSVLMSNRNSNGGTINNYGNTAGGGEKIIEKVLDSTVNIPPTLFKNQGDHIQVMVARDLDFSKVYGLRVAQ